MLPVVTDYQALYKQYKRAREQVAKGAEEPVLVVKNIEHSAALAFADKLECRGFSFVPSESQRGIGSLYFFVDTSYIHELVSHEVTSSSSMYLMPWALPGEQACTTVPFAPCSRRKRQHRARFVFVVPARSVRSAGSVRCDS